MQADIAIVGAGLVGTTAALALARQGRSVLLIERQRPEVRRGRLGADARTVALNPASRALLEAVEVWPALRVCPYQAMMVWEDTGTAQLAFDAQEAGVPALGWITEVSPAAVALWQACVDEPGVTLIEGTLQTLTEVPQGWQLQVDGTEALATLVLAADGAASAVRTLLGLDAEVFDTGQQALATVVQTERPHGHCARQRFLCDGPLALLPLPDQDERHQVSIVWSQSEALAQARQSMSDAAFCAELTQASEACLGQILAVDQRFVFPLRQQLAADFAPRPGIVLLGDAAHVLHPLAGQGVNLGFEDVTALLELLQGVPTAAMAEPALWRGWARRRRLRSRLLLGAMDAFRVGYAQRTPALQWLRNAGVRSLSQLPAIKRSLIREALGLGPVAATLGNRARTGQQA
jgi:2-polyprenylphenol 6-hydroxylase